MSSSGISDLARRHGVEPGSTEEDTKKRVLRAIEKELTSLQMPEPTKAQHERQLALMSDRNEVQRSGQTVEVTSTELTPSVAMRQMIEIAEAIRDREPKVTQARSDTTATMRTSVKATATKASSDFKRERSLPLAGAAALLASLYGLRTIFGIGDLQLPSEYFYPFFWSACGLVFGSYILSVLAQTYAKHTLLSLYDPEVQEDALDFLGEQTSEFFGSHAARWVETRADRYGRVPQAFDDDENGYIFNRSVYRYYLHDSASSRWRLKRALAKLSTIDLEEATEDATGSALDRLCELGIVIPIVQNSRQVFRFAQTETVMYKPLL